MQRTRASRAALLALLIAALGIACAGARGGMTVGLHSVEERPVAERSSVQGRVLVVLASPARLVAQRVALRSSEPDRGPGRRLDLVAFGALCSLAVLLRRQRVDGVVALSIATARRVPRRRRGPPVPTV